LGLALVLGFVKLMKGHLGVSTNAVDGSPDIPTGSIFWFEIPLLTMPIGASAEKEVRLALGGSKLSVLCVSQSKLVTEMLKSNLEGNGNNGWVVIAGETLEAVLDSSAYKNHVWSSTVVITQRYEDYGALEERLEKGNMGSVRWLLLTKHDLRSQRGFYALVDEPVRKSKLVQTVTGAFRNALAESQPSKLCPLKSRRDSQRGFEKPGSLTRQVTFDVTSRVHTLSQRRQAPLPEDEHVEPFQAETRSRTSSVKEGALDAGSEAPKSYEVLLVDDTAVTQMLAKQTLSSAGFVVEAARNGLEAVEKWRSKEFDVIVTDIEMEVGFPPCSFYSLVPQVLSTYFRIPDCATRKCDTSFFRSTFANVFPMYLKPKADRDSSVS
jgi:hypothetical protein